MSHSRGLSSGDQVLSEHKFALFNPHFALFTLHLLFFSLHFSILPVFSSPVFGLPVFFHFAGQNALSALLDLSWT